MTEQQASATSIPNPRRRNRPILALCGNPNCGKTTIFNALTGLSQRVANYPGVTVERMVGELRFSDELVADLIDIPGAYSLSSTSPDESIATETLFCGIDGERAPDLIVAVTDGANLERGLYLILQLAALGKPMVIAVTMSDEVVRQGLRLDTARLAEQTGADVIMLVANKGKGIAELKSAIQKQLQGNRFTIPRNCYPGKLRELANSIVRSSGETEFSEAEAIRSLLDESSPAASRFVDRSPNHRAMLERARQECRALYPSSTEAEMMPLKEEGIRIAGQVLHSASSAANLTSGAQQSYLSRGYSDKIDRVALHPVLGPLLFVAIMFLMFQSIFSWAAPVMDLIDGLFSSLSSRVGMLLPPGAFSSLVTDGIISGVGGVLVFLPQIVLLFLFISLLEDSGYMPRAALIVDRLLGWCGLSGRSFIPMLSSFACAVPGIMATRTIEDRRVRYLTIMVAPLMSCSARLPVYTVMIAACIPASLLFGVVSTQGLVLFAMYLIGVMTAAAVAFLFTRITGQTQKASFVMEMPRYQRPMLRNVSLRVYQRAKSFVLRAGTLILAISILIWAASYYPRPNAIIEEYRSMTATVETDASLTESQRESRLAEISAEQNGALLRASYFGQAGKLLEPLFLPLGWDWKITLAALASFPAREVVISTLSTIYNLGDDGNTEGLVKQLQSARWDHGEKSGSPVFTPATALSLMVFFALCCQCGATVMTIKQEMGRWSAALLAFAYMTILAYLGAFFAYKVAGSLWG